MKYLIFSIIAFSMMGLIFPAGFSEIFIHESDYPFSIQYPNGWYIFEFPEDEGGGISIDSDRTGLNGFYITLWCSESRGDDCGQAGADYQELDYLKEDNELACSEATYSNSHHRCFNYEVIDEYVHQLDGYRAFTIVYSETWLQDGKDPVFTEAEKGKYDYDNLVKWIENPDAIKLGTRMKNHASIYKNENKLTNEQINQIAKYLLSLKPSMESSATYNK